MSQATVTAKTGPGVTVTSHVFDNLLSITFDLFNQVFTVVYGSGEIRHFSLNEVTTVTDSVSGAVHIWVVS
jgi:hypothetical protein